MPDMAKTPTISVIERRLQSPDVFRQSSQPIPMKEPKRWITRWMSPASRSNRMWEGINFQAWVYVEPDDLTCAVEDIGGLVEDMRIVKGERGPQREFLMKQPVKDYTRMQKKKTEETIKQTFGKKQLKNAIVSGVAAEHGEQASDYIAKNVNLVSVNDARGPEDE